MELKKSKKANLENKKGIFFKIGLSIILLLLIFSFNYKTKNYNQILNSGTTLATLDEPDMVITRRKEEIKPPKPKIVEQIKIVDNDKDIDDDIDIPDVESFDTDSIPIDIDLDTEKEPDTFEPYMVEEKASFIGGYEQFNKFLVNNIKYPEICKENQIEGTVVLKFIVDKYGKINNITVAKHSDENLEKEVIRVLLKSPKWNPARQNGKAVAMYFYLPFDFKLN